MAWGAVSALLLGFASVAAARTSKTGYDLSYPQCGNGLPTHRAFGIVGVNGGLANDANGCLRRELLWANRSPGLTTPSQAPASLYINTADPGPSVADWPTSGDAGSYGTCTKHKWSEACAYIYGEDRATYSYGLVTSISPNLAELASEAPWWLDIETSNTWATQSNAGYKRLNIAAIRGFIVGLTSAGAPAPVGIYSIGNEWQTITGLTPQNTARALGASALGWIGVTGTLDGARKACASTGFDGGGPTLAQYGARGFDADLRCG
jgi:hypothetical protein